MWSVPYFLVLKQERVSIHDNFFDLGGHSLLLVQVHNLLQTDYPELTVMDFFSYPMIKSLADYLEQTKQQQPAIPIFDQQAAKTRSKQRRAHQAARRRKQA